MKRNFENYAKLGHEIVQKYAQYDLTQEEMDKSIDLYEEAMKRNPNPLHAIIIVAMFFYHAGIETGRRFERNRKG